MNQEWVKTLREMEGLPVAEHEVTGEWAVQLKKGELYEYSAELYGCCVYDWRAANKLIKRLGLKKKPCRAGDELMFTFAKDGQTLATVIEVLGRRSKGSRVLQAPQEFIEEFSSKSGKFTLSSRDLTSEGPKGSTRAFERQNEDFPGGSHEPGA